MAGFTSSSTTRRRPRNFLLALFGCATVLGGAAISSDAEVPNFMGDYNTAWLPDRPTGDDFLPPPSGPGPVMSPEGRPYVPNGTGQQPTYRIADLSNLI
jgi:hypothetical protein